ncbi:MAG: MarC family protein [Chlamydiota bacterium]
METVSFFTICLSLFLVYNSIGQIPVFLALLTPYDEKRQRFITIREVIFSFVILLLFIFFGKNVLTSLGITPAIIGIAGGILLFLISLELLFPPKTPSTIKEIPKHEPFVVPLAFPGLAGPGAIATIMIYTNQYGTLMTISALVVITIISLFVLLLASSIKKHLGEKGVLAAERVGGMLICLIGINMLSKGLVLLVHENFILK